MRILSHIYVIGNIDPDTDSIASAIGCVWLLIERDDVDIITARVGCM